jgi:hypothetical protein
MKKLQFLFSYLLFLSFLSISCNKDEGIISPDPKGWGNPEAGSFLYVVDLVQDESIIGEVQINKLTDGGLQIIYSLNVDCNGRLTNVNVDIAKGDGSPYSIDFNINSEGAPEYSYFDSNTISDVLVSGLGTKVVTIFFNNLALNKALNGNIPSKFYLAIHGIVTYEDTTRIGFVPPEDLTRNSVLADFKNLANVFTFEFDFETGVVNEKREFNGWCIDLSHSFTGSEGQNFNFVYSYDSIPDCLVDIPANLAKANWIINHREGYNWAEVQMAIWYLLSPYEDGDIINPADYPIYSEGDYKSLVNAAIAYEELNGPFQPLCSDKVLILAYDGFDPCSRKFQSIAFELDAQCSEIHKNVIGYPFPIDKFSSPFLNAMWFRYISFDY